MTRSISALPKSKVATASSNSKQVVAVPASVSKSKQVVVAHDDEEVPKTHGGTDRIPKTVGSINHRNWLARANRIGSKLEVFNESVNYRGTPLKTVSRLTVADLDKIPVLDKNGDQKTVTITKTKKGKTRTYEVKRSKIVYKSRHKVGKMIHEYTHVEIKNFPDLEDRKRNLRDYFINDSKSGEAGLDDSAMYQKYLDIETQPQLDKWNAKVREKAKQWNDMNEKMSTYFTKTDKKGKLKKNWKKPSNSKKIRLRGHLSTSGEKIRNCLVNMGTSESCAKEDCDNKKINATQIYTETERNQGGNKYCTSPSKKIKKGRM